MKAPNVILLGQNQKSLHQHGHPSGSLEWLALRPASVTTSQAASFFLISRQVFGPPNTAAPRPLRNVANSYPDHPLLFSPADYKWLQVGWEHCSWTSELRCLICTPASVLSKTQIGSIFKKLQWARCRDQSDWQLFFQPDRQHSVKIRCNVTKWDWSSDGLQTKSKLKGNDLYSNYSLFSISRIFHLPLYLSDTAGKNWAWRK